MKYVVTIEETISKAVIIEASSLEQAMDNAERMYALNEIVLDGDATVTSKQMMAEGPNGEVTEWTSF